jgi:hypothetical protein
VPLSLLLRFKSFRPTSARLARASTPAMPAPAPMPIEVLVERGRLAVDVAREVVGGVMVIVSGDAESVAGGTVRGIGKAEGSSVTPTLD